MVVSRLEIVKPLISRSGPGSKLEVKLQKYLQRVDPLLLFSWNVFKHWHTVC